MQVFQEVETFLRDAQLDLMLIQETKWSTDMQRSSRGHHYVHSAGANKLDKVGGVLTIISEKLAKASDLQFIDVHPGRLLHVRVQTRRATLDVLNCYQYALNEKPGTHERRQAWLKRLQRCLSGLPNRHALIMAGDFNSQCSLRPKVCGPWALPVGEAHKADSQELMDLLAPHSLCVLNTWTRPHMANWRPSPSAGWSPR